MRRRDVVMLLAALTMTATAAPAGAQVPESEVPGSSPAGKMEQLDRSRVPKDPARHPTPQTPDPNYPKPEPLAPRTSPDSPPPLPGKKSDSFVLPERLRNPPPPRESPQ